MDRRRDNLTVLFGVEVLKCFPAIHSKRFSGLSRSSAVKGILWLLFCIAPALLDGF